MHKCIFLIVILCTIAFAIAVCSQDIPGVATPAGPIPATPGSATPGPATPGPTGILIGKEDTAKYLLLIVPDEYRDFQKAAGKNNESDTVTAALAMIAKTELLSLQFIKTRHYPPDNMKDGLVLITHEFAWMNTIQYRKTLKSTDESKRILTEWDKSLDRNQLDKEIFSLQVHALAWEWDRAFMTDKTTKLFKDTYDPDIINIFCRTFQASGGIKERDLLDAKALQIEEYYKAVKRNINMARGMINVAPMPK